MTKTRKVLLGSLLSVCALSLAACGKDDKVDNSYFDFEDPSAQVNVATAGAVENFVASSYEEREKILGLLEKFAVENDLTGIPLFDDGGYVKYSPRLQIPTNPMKNPDGSDMVIGGTVRHNYITGYGFGVMEEGSIKGTLSGNVSFPSYYHTFEVQDPATLNYMNDNGSVVSGLNSYVASGYFGNRMNATHDGYEWFPSLANEKNKVQGEVRPIPYNPTTNKLDDTNLQLLANKYRIYVRTDDVQYATLGKFSEFNGRKVQLKDYETPYKELFNQSNGLARGADNLSGAAAIKGAVEYYNATEKGFDQEAWDNFGFKTGTDPQNGDYIEIEFVTPCTPFYAMYYISGGIYAPIPQDFLTKIGGIKQWGAFSADKKNTPIDTTLSTGPFVVEAWQNDKEIVFKNNDKLNPAVKGGENRFTIDGIHIQILKSAAEDQLAAWKEFKAGKLDSVGIPKDYLKSERDTPNTQQTKGSSVTKLNVNTTTQEEWDALFGPNGTVLQTPESEKYIVEPAMSNTDFIKGLNFSIDRKEYATNRGRTPSINFFSDNYLSNPEKGISYNETETHKKVMRDIYGDSVDTFGYDFDKAVEYFHKAATDMLNKGIYKEKDVITVEIWWQAQNQTDTFGADISKYMEKAFNDPAVCDNKLTLKVENKAVANWMDVYDKHMQVGQFDMGFGSISGNALNPINFLEVLKSDNSSRFTLNWGPNTNDPNQGLIDYDGKKFTFDALWQAADSGALVASDGSLAKTTDAAVRKNVANEDGSRTVEILFAGSNIADVVTTTLKQVVLCWYDGPEYEETPVEFSLKDGVITLTIPKELADKYQGAISFDLVVETKLGTNDPTTKITSLNGTFPYPLS